MKRRVWMLLAVLLAAPGFAQDEQTCAEGERLFDHEYMENGPLCIPDKPQRIVALDMGAAEATLFTGKDLVGAAPWVLGEMPLLLPELEAAFEGLEDLGYPANLESILALKPDLILTTSDAVDVAAASEIAPVVVGDEESYRSWESGLQLYSGALNRSDIYDELKANFETRLTELQMALGEARTTTEVSVISVSPGATWLWLPDSAVGRIIEEVGLARPEPQSLKGEAAKERYEDAPFPAISDERLDLADGDVIFAFDYATSDPKAVAEGEAYTKAFQENPLWQSLSAVQSGNVHFVGGHWWRAQTYLLVNKVIDDLFTYLAGEPGQTQPLRFEAIAQE